MVEPRAFPQCGNGPAAGFTLVEMLVALAILVVSVTTLLAALGDSMALRGSTDARLLAAVAAEDFVHQLTSSGLRARADATDQFDLELALPAEIPVPAYPTMKLRPVLELPAGETDALRRDVFLLRLQVEWLDRGEPQTETFWRVLPRQLPLGMRVQRFRDDNRTKVNR